MRCVAEAWNERMAKHSNIPNATAIKEMRVCRVCMPGQCPMAGGVYTMYIIMLVQCPMAGCDTIDLHRRLAYVALNLPFLVTQLTHTGALVMW
jgi:hypothetical protein